MKIGIISMQRVPNYGSFLQAYGLKATLEKSGHEVVFIDYKEEEPVVPFNKRDRLRYKVMGSAPVKHLNDWCKYYLAKKRLFDYKYRLEYLKELGIGYKKNYNEKVDVAIIGSDEVFNCLQDGFNVGFSPMLFGQNVNADKVISYAASFGYSDMAGLKRYGVDGTVASYLKSFSAISVRDDNSKDIVKRLIGLAPELNLDPVLVSDYALPEVNIPFDNYVVLYTYKSRGYSEQDKAQIIDFCKRNHKTLISIGSAQDWVEKKIDASPLELLVYLKKADFIITDTFHGTVFSIKYNRPFATLVRENNRQKLGDLLKRLKKEERVIGSFADLQDMYEKDMDYSETNAVIARERESTIIYLQKNLQ